MSVKIQWLGQAGFLITSPSQKTIAIDPYLSNTCQALVGYKRMVPAPICIDSFTPDFLLVSHEHPDHLDTDLLPYLAAHGQTHIYYNPGSEKYLADNSLTAPNATVISAGESIHLGDVTVSTLRADHGDAAPDALGFILNVDGITIYFAGDTALTPDLLMPAIDIKPDIALLPINGMYGNLGSEDAAQLAALLQCKIVIPCHFGMFVEHGGNPLSFSDQMQKHPDIKVNFLSLGETAIYDKSNF